MRGRDGGRGDAGRDIGVWSVAIQGNLSCYGDTTYKRAACGGGSRTRPPGPGPARVWASRWGSSPGQDRGCRAFQRARGSENRGTASSARRGRTGGEAGCRSRRKTRIAEEGPGREEAAPPRTGPRGVTPIPRRWLQPRRRGHAPGVRPWHRTCTKGCVLSSPITGCEFSGQSTLLTLATGEAKSGGDV
jgi:hypothetical protein